MTGSQKLAVHRKNKERKKRQKRIDTMKIEQRNEDTTSIGTLTCPISLSLTAFTLGHVQSVSELSRHFKALISRYSTWNITSVDPLIICKMDIQNEAAIAVSIIATLLVSSNFHWTVTWKTQKVDTKWLTRYSMVYLRRFSQLLIR